MTRRAILIPALLLLLAGLAAVFLLQQGGSQDLASNAERAERLKAEHRPFLVYFYSQTCEQCREMEAILSEVHPEFSGAVPLLEVDISNRADKALVQSAGVMAVPSLAFYDSAGQKRLIVGVMPAGTLRDHLQALSAAAD
jgi:thiol:disulfide interchange protein